MPLVADDSVRFRACRTCGTEEKKNGTMKTTGMTSPDGPSHHPPKTETDRRCLFLHAPATLIDGRPLIDRKRSIMDGWGQSLSSIIARGGTKCLFFPQFSFPKLSCCPLRWFINGIQIDFEQSFWTFKPPHSTFKFFCTIISRPKAGHEWETDGIFLRHLVLEWNYFYALPASSDVAVSSHYKQM